MMSGMRVRVVGAGVVGLAVALRLREAGHAVDVVAAQVGEQTTSAVAAALWYPYRALPETAVTRWAGLGYRVLAGLCADPGAGVDMRAGRQLLRTATPDPWWAGALPSFDRVRPADLPPGYVDGFELTVPVVDMALHLPWLTGRLAAMGVAVRRARVADLGEKEALLAEQPKAFFTIPHFDGYSAVLIQLRTVTKRALREAIVDGWLACAPPDLARSYLDRGAAPRR